MGARRSRASQGTRRTRSGLHRAVPDPFALHGAAHGRSKGVERRRSSARRISVATCRYRRHRGPAEERRAATDLFSRVTFCVWSFASGYLRARTTNNHTWLLGRLDLAGFHRPRIAPADRSQVLRAVPAACSARISATARLSGVETPARAPSSTTPP